MPVVMGSLGMMKKGIDKFINKIPGSPGLYEMQKNCFVKKLFI